MSKENITLKIDKNDTQMKENKLYLEKKVVYYQDLVQKTIISVQKYKNLDILGASEINVCIRTLESIFTDLFQIRDSLDKKKLTKQSLDKLLVLADSGELYLNLNLYRLTSLTSIVVFMRAL